MSSSRGDRSGLVKIVDRDSQAVHSLAGSFVRERLSGETSENVMAILEHECFSGFHTVWHQHRHSALGLLLLDGRVEVQWAEGFTSLTAGSVAFFPTGAVHQVSVTSPVARFVSVHVPGGIEKAVRVMGKPVRELGPDGQRVVPPHDDRLPGWQSIARKYGIEIKSDVAITETTTSDPV